MQTMVAATAVSGTTSCGKAAAHAPNSGGAAPCRAAATYSGVASCRGLQRASEGFGAPSPVARRQVPLAAITIGGGSVKVSPPSSLVARW
ncbi:hypothetical protein GUJ93_ZPchr0002g26793 [Zizania palustris]|uniref:Uncharacterized protein n=1 Tax=Zizania palustris TaxID=103762 RepID=A0A8J5S623_ZIZPA|nr:hypothetical protein GUJ93_ZPchr0002g26793 [Zizania palustris]